LFKAGISRECGKLSLATDLFQRGFLDHVVRSHEALGRIREYILNNPRQWALDRENPQRNGLDPFDLWWREEIEATNVMRKPSKLHGMR
jgi:hypothetical protein